MKKALSRKYKFILNTISSLINQIITIVCGFILPRNMLLFWGSETTGLISSITQFLGFISFMQMGVGVVVQSAWYKPLNDNNREEISRIYVSAQKFFRTIAIIFVFYTAAVSIIYPRIVDVNESNVYVMMLTFVISITLFGQYYWGLTNSLLLNADQKSYIPFILQSIVLIANVVLSVKLMYAGYSVLIVKLISVLVCLLTPIGLAIYVKKNYKINTKVRYEEEPIKQKWSGFGQHISAVVVDNTDIIVLTLFSNLSNVSVYYVYYSVVYAIRNLLVSVTGGVQALFGNMLTKNETKQLQEVFSDFEVLFGFLTTFIYGCVISLIIPFVRVYTKEINDANYIVPSFAIIITIAYAMFCYRTIYYTLIKAAGHFKETQNSAIIEAVINIIVSVVCVKYHGLIGVAIGTVIAMSYRTTYCAWYLSRNIVKIRLRNYLKNMSLNLLIFFLCYLVSKTMSLKNIDFVSWIVLAVKVTIINFMICTGLYLCIYRKRFFELRYFVKKLGK